MFLLNICEASVHLLSDLELTLMSSDRSIASGIGMALCWHAPKIIADYGAEQAKSGRHDFLKI